MHSAAASWLLFAAKIELPKTCGYNPIERKPP
jgi:hypothetical protein